MLYDISLFNVEGTVWLPSSALRPDIISKQAKRKRIAELSVGTLPLENLRKSHLDFVLEEMTWLENDFAQV